MDFSSILSHPNREDIISKLLTGTDPKDVSQWLKLLYPDKEQAHLRLSIKILQDFSKSQYADFYDQHTKEITTAIQTGQLDKLDKKLADSLLNNKTLKERLTEHATKEINVRERFLSLDLLIRDRIEQVFDKIQENPAGMKGDYVLLKWVEQYLNLVEKYDKQVNNRPDQIVHHTHTVQYINQTNAAMQEVLREVLAMYDPEMAIFLMEKISEKLNGIKPPVEAEFQTVDDRLESIKSLETAMSSNKDKV